VRHRSGTRGDREIGPLAAAPGGPEGAAARLGMKRSTPYKKMKKLGISRLPLFSSRPPLPGTMSGRPSPLRSPTATEAAGPAA
jgi:hypothetical protein